MNPHDIAALNIGDTLFINDGTEAFRFGQYEGLDPLGDVLVSFRSGPYKRREMPEPIPSSAIFLPSTVGVNYDNTPPIGTRVIIPKPGGRIISVARVLDISDFPQGSLSVRNLTLDTYGAWIEIGDSYTFDTKMQEVFPGPFFAVVQQWRYRQPVDPYYDVIIAPVGVSASSYSFAGDLTSNGITLPITGSFDVTGFELAFNGTVPFSVAQRLDDATMMNFDRGTLEFTSDDTIVEVSHVAFMGATHHFEAGKPPEPAPIKLATPNARITFGKGDVAFTRETYKGIKLNYCDHILHREPVANLFIIEHRLATAGDCIRTTVFGKPAIIYEPRVGVSADDHYVAVLYHGAPLPPLERRALSALIGYLGGGRAQHVSQETFDVRSRLSIEIAQRGSAAAGMMPVPLDYPGQGPVIVARFIPIMLDAMLRELKRDAQGIEAALHHYSEGSVNSHPTKAIADMSIAIDALIASYTDDEETSAALINQVEFKKLRKLLTAALVAGIQSGELPSVDSKTRTRLQTKIDNLNTASNTKRFERFWHELGVNLRKRDVKILRKRHPAVHRGYPEDQAGNRALLRSYINVRHLANLFNRAFLLLLKYDGPVIDAASNNRAWITLRRGLPYNAQSRKRTSRKRPSKGSLLG